MVSHSNLEVYFLLFSCVFFLFLVVFLVIIKWFTFIDQTHNLYPFIIGRVLIGYLVREKKPNLGDYCTESGCLLYNTILIVIQNTCSKQRKVKVL